VLQAVDLQQQRPKSVSIPESWLREQRLKDDHSFGAEWVGTMILQQEIF
jgi:hypothetical protein